MGRRTSGRDVSDSRVTYVWFFLELIYFLLPILPVVAVDGSAGDLEALPGTKIVIRRQEHSSNTQMFRYLQPESPSQDVYVFSAGTALLQRQCREAKHLLSTVYGSFKPRGSGHKV